MDIPAVMQGEGVGNAYDLIVCPYNPAHLIQRYKMQGHLMKCGRHHQKTDLKICPFNASHVIPEGKFDHHISTCINRTMLDQVKYNLDPASDIYREPNVSAPEVPAAEDWENENNTPFDPTANLSAQILRSKKCIPPAERKAFRAEQIKNYRNKD